MRKFFLYTLLALLLIPSDAVTAQTSEQNYGLNINPFIIESDVAKGGTSSNTVTITNWTNEILNIEVVAKDFIPNYETGQPIFVPDNEINDKTYSLAQWVSINGAKTIELQPKESRDVQFTLNPPDNAEQGSHYGAILFNYKVPVKRGSIGQVSQTVGAVILVNYGVGREMGKSRLSSDKKVLLGGDSFELTSTFANTGNVHIRPKGEIHIKNIFGKVVSSLPINRDAEVLLPGVEKNFRAKWHPTGFSFGRYTAEANLVYGKNRLEARGQQVIWVLPVHLVVLGLFLMAGLAWFSLRGIHIYNRWLISGIKKNKELS